MKLFLFLADRVFLWFTGVSSLVRALDMGFQKAIHDGVCIEMLT